LFQIETTKIVFFFLPIQSLEKRAYYSGESAGIVYLSDPGGEKLMLPDHPQRQKWPTYQDMGSGSLGALPVHPYIPEWSTYQI